VHDPRFRSEYVSQCALYDALGFAGGSIFESAGEVIDHDLDEQLGEQAGPKSACYVNRSSHDQAIDLVLGSRDGVSWRQSQRSGLRCYQVSG